MNLKPCPFAKCAEPHSHHLSYTISDPSGWCVRCSCGTQGPAFKSKMDAEAQQKAILEWNRMPREWVDNETKVSEFIQAIHDVCSFYGLGIEHEDNHGAFFVVPFEQNGFGYDARVRLSGQEKEPKE